MRIHHEVNARKKKHFLAVWEKVSKKIGQVELFENFKKIFTFTYKMLILKRFLFIPWEFHTIYLIMFFLPPTLFRSSPTSRSTPFPVLSLNNTPPQKESDLHWSTTLGNGACPGAWLISPVRLFTTLSGPQLWLQIDSWLEVVLCAYLPFSLLGFGVASVWTAGPVHALTVPVN